MEFAPAGELFDKVFEEYEDETLNEMTAKLKVSSDQPCCCSSSRRKHLSQGSKAGEYPPDE